MKSLMKSPSTLILAACALTAFAPPTAQNASAAGLLTPNGAQQSLAIASQKVDVTINNGISVTTVEQIFRNDQPQPLEAMYTFPIPPRASVSNFSMWINGQEVIGEVVEAKEGRRIYDTIVRPEQPVRKFKDPGLLEETKTHTFRMSVFPVPANGEQRIQITYYQPLDYENGVMRYVYPLAMRTDSAGVDPNAEMNGVALTRAGNSSQMTGPLTITVEARSEIPIKLIESPSHPDALASATVTPNTFRAGVEEQQGRLDRDFVLYFQLERPSLGANLITSRDPKDDGYFYLFLTPGSEFDRDPKPLNATFVLDTSGSMEGDNKLNAAARATMAAVKSLKEDDTFNIVAFSIAPKPMAEQPIKADAAGIARAESFLRGLMARGGTNLLAAMETAVMFNVPERANAIVLLSDGEATDTTNHEPYVKLIQAQAPGSKPRIVSIGVGNDVNRPLLDRLSRDTGGFVAYLSSEDRMNEIAPAMVNRLRVPYADKIQIATKPGNGVELYDITPGPMPNLYHGGQFIAFGRYRGSGAAPLKLSATIDGQPRTIELAANFPAVDSSAPEIQRMWAWHKIQDLLRVIYEGKESSSTRDEIVALGTAYSITSPYTSFLVLENEQMYRDFQIERRNKRRITNERQAQATRQQNPQPIGQQFRPMDNSTTGGPSGGAGGGAISPIGLLVMGGAAACAVIGRRRRDDGDRVSTSLNHSQGHS
jgi:Ca-activated chloride channel homolog